MKKQIYLTPAAGKRLIAKALANNEKILRIAREHTLVITSGTTDAYVGDEIFKALGLPDFDMTTLYAGVFMGPDGIKKASHRDLVIRKGEYLPEYDIAKIAPELTKEDMILKGGNALYLRDRQVGVSIGNPEFGKLAPICAAVYGKRVQLLMPIGLEKRIECPVTVAERFVNDPENTGLRLAYAPGEPYTELDVFEDMGLHAMLLSAGGVGGYEGGVIIGLEGPEEAMKRADELVSAVKDEPRYGLR